MCRCILWLWVGCLEGLLCGGGGRGGETPGTRSVSCLLRSIGPNLVKHD